MAGGATEYTLLLGGDREHTEQQLQRFFNFLKRNKRTRVKVVLLGGGKLLSSIGQALIGMLEFCDNHGVDPQIRDLLAALASIASGIVTTGSRLPSIARKAADKTELDFKKFCKSIWKLISCGHIRNCRDKSIIDVLGQIIVGLSYVSACFVYISADLFGRRVTTKYLSKNPYFEGVIGFYTAGCAWYSFRAYSIEDAKVSGMSMAKSFAQGLREPSWPAREKVITGSLVFFLLIANAVRSYFFVKIALKEFMLTAYVIPDSWIPYIAGLSTIPSFMTNLATKGWSVYQVVADVDKAKVPMPLLKRFKLPQYLWMLFGFIDILTAACGTFEAGRDTLEDFEVDPSSFSMSWFVLYVAANVLFLVFPDALQNYTFTVLKALKEFAYWAEPKLRPDDYVDLEAPYMYFNDLNLDESSDLADSDMSESYADDIPEPHSDRLPVYRNGSNATFFSDPKMPRRASFHEEQCSYVRLLPDDSSESDSALSV